MALAKKVLSEAQTNEEKRSAPEAEERVEFFLSYFVKQTGLKFKVIKKRVSDGPVNYFSTIEAYSPKGVPLGTTTISVVDPASNYEDLLIGGTDGIFKMFNSPDYGFGKVMKNAHAAYKKKFRGL